MFKFFAGLFIGLSLTAAAATEFVAKVTSDGVLEGYIVQKDGKDVCQDPIVYSQFRDGKNYVVCDWDQ